MDSKATVRLERELYPWERAILGACRLYLVGGTVRDILLGRSIDSVDADYLAAEIPLDDLTAILGRFGKLNLVGKSFGVIKFTPADGRTVDISLPRSEFSTGAGHRDFDVRFDPNLPLEKDLERRDFTINSMALDLSSLEIVDPLGGRADLAARLLRVNRSDSFVEDPLRILRGAQFVARFDLSVEAGTLELMKRDAKLLAAVSPERVRDELDKVMLLAECPSRGFLFMHEAGMLAEVLPELDATHGVTQNEFHPDDVFLHSLKSCDLVRRELHLRWAALLHDLGKKAAKTTVDGRVVFYRHEEESERTAEEVLERLRYPRELVRRVGGLVRHHMFNITEDWSDSAIRRFIARAGPENIDDLLALREADNLSRGDASVVDENRMIRERIDRVRRSDAAFKITDLAIDGKDVMEILGIRPGPEIGAVLKRLFDSVLENPGLNTREALTGLVREMGNKK
jgi:tRNA nucleotidyltransferase (CCA-adding enzyme)